jgi:cell division septation protein DedD
LAQDDYYYEIQLTNKQLVFYFMAGAAGLILSFLAGVMVGRGVDTAASADGQTRPVAEERIVSEQPAATPSPADYSYPQRLEAEHPEATLEPSHGSAPVASPTPARPVATARPTPAATPTATPTARPAPPRPTATPAHTPTPRPAPASLPKPLPSTKASGFAVQVGAFKDEAGAVSVREGLQKKGLPAYVSGAGTESGGLFTVRVGPYRERVDAETVAERLRADQFKAFIIKQ